MKPLAQVPVVVTKPLLKHREQVEGILLRGQIILNVRFCVARTISQLVALKKGDLIHTSCGRAGTGRKRLSLAYGTGWDGIARH